ncbi:outer membrane beta-barrel protein [Pontibacter harenae]|uniref:outer membrane beta-barrel protein n=1 Tax=Pontibacter harenae TaxID=2894083 RepID=UPI00210789FA|nr:outer membrane beta-barrel protein [Pontibacter harenae]
MKKELNLFCISLLSLLLFFPKSGFTQHDSTVQVSPSITFPGFLDVYYAYDFDKPTTDYRQPFLYNHNRHNEFNLNLGFVKVAAEHSRYRANLALQAGTYAQDNYAAEQDLFKHVFEANVGILTSNAHFG